MTAPSATVEVWVDGVRVASTADELAGGAVTVLDGLKVTWGRDGANEQPGPAACSFQLADPAGRDDVLDVLHVGSDVNVWAQGQIPGTVDPWGPSTFDPQQSTWTGLPDGLPPPRAVFGVDWTGQPGATSTARIKSEQLALWSSVPNFGPSIPPRPFSPVGELPDAWDDIPQANAGETWLVRAAVWAPAGIRWWPMIRSYRAPYGDGGVAMVGTQPNQQTGTGAWQQFEFQMRIQSMSEPAWLALYVQMVDPTGLGRRWQDQTTTWAAQTKTWGDPSWADTILVDNITMQPPGTGTTRRVLVFSGEVSDVKVAPWGNQVSTQVDVTAMDLGAILGNTVIGDTPWPVQTVAVRGTRISDLAGVTTSPRIRIDPPLDALQVSARDVDAQPAFQLLTDLAQSAGGVLWVATHAVTGPFLWMENPDGRAAVRELTLTGGVIVITGSTDDVLIVSACDLLEESAEWLQSTEDVSTVVAVTWLEQGVDDDGEPTATERTVTVTDAAGVALYGTRRLSISTELISESDATTMANRLLAQARKVAWRLAGLVWDTGQHLPASVPTVSDAARQIAFLTLLDGTSRMGAAVTLVDMPDYAPRGSVSSVYVEGGAYTYTGDAWRLELVTSPSAGQGKGATWGQLDAAWKWNQWQPALTWQDLYGVAP